jgi:ribosomal protein S18 acetylase RimI-like enzyme
MYREQEKRLRTKALFAMYVAAAARGQGLARRLLETAVEHGRALNLRQLMLGCNAGNGNALRLYEQAGFSEYGLEPAALYVDGEYFDEVLMVMKLD